MALKPWYRVVNPREDLRDGRPLDASDLPYTSTMCVMAKPASLSKSGKVLREHS